MRLFRMLEPSVDISRLVVGLIAAIAAMVLPVSAAQAQESPAAAVKPLAVTEIYSNFNADPLAAYDCCSAWAVAGPDHFHGPTEKAMPFTPAGDYRVRSISVAVAYSEGTNGVTVALHKDDGGVPGALVKQAAIAGGIPTFGTCCTVMTLNVNGVKVKAGQQYWVVLRTGKRTLDTWVGWNLSNIGIEGPAAFYFPWTGWIQYITVPGAFSVSGIAMR